MSERGHAKPLRVAIAGLGPKGLFALERLFAAIADDEGPRPVELDLFEPHPAPGAGPVYDPSQPSYLRMNLAAHGVDVWGRPNHSLPSDSQLNFVAWRERTAGEGATEEYPPRAQVGEYLNWCFERLIAHPPAAVALTLHREALDAVASTPDGWRVDAGESTAIYDEILLCVGHQSGDAESMALHEPVNATLVAAVFPVEQWASSDQVPTGSSVAVRGFGLSFLDAALALTEGRGGIFERLDPRGWRLHYRRSGTEPAAILPYSRTGKTMLAKPVGVAEDDELGAIGRAGAALVGTLSGSGAAVELVEIVAGTASAYLSAAGPGGNPAELRAQAAAWIATPDDGPAPGSNDVAAAIERSLRIGAGEQAPDLNWALARAWLALLPEIVDHLGGGALDQAGWVVFRELARKMERIAFGPPPINAAKLLALIDAGIVDLGHLRRGELVDGDGATALRSPAAKPPVLVDAVIDAVMPAPGVLGSHAGLYAPLIATGLAHVRDGRRGVEVADDGSCLAACGQPAGGLATIGRPTEDSVIDNDTLNRDRHPHPRLWAERVAKRTRPAKAPGEAAQAAA